MYKDHDKENMYGSIWNFPDNLRDAFIIGEKISLKNKYYNIQNIIIAGMGGSAIGGDMVAILDKSNF